MSVDYFVYLRDRPVLRENFFLSNQGDERSARRKVDEHADDDVEGKLLVDDTRTEGWIFAGLHLDIAPYDPEADPYDGLHEHGDPALVSEVRWVVHASGRLRESEWDSWDGWSTDLAARCRGALYSPMDDELRWIEPRTGDDREEREDEPASWQPARRSEPSRPPSTQDQVAREPLEALFPEVIADSPRTFFILERIRHERASWRAFAAFLLKQAREGASRPVCLDQNFEDYPWRIPPTVTEAKSRARRDEFASRGSLARAIVAQWDSPASQEAAGKTAHGEELLDRRRRSGELLVPLPDDIRKLVTAGKVEVAVTTYARRYGLSETRARAVVARPKGKRDRI